MIFGNVIKPFNKYFLITHEQFLITPSQFKNGYKFLEIFSLLFFSKTFKDYSFLMEYVNPLNPIYIWWKKHPLFDKQVLFFEF